VYEPDPSPPEDPTPDVEVSEQPSSVGEGEVVECEEDVELRVELVSSAVKDEGVMSVEWVRSVGEDDGVLHAVKVASHPPYHADPNIVPVGFEQLLKALSDLIYPGDVEAFMLECPAYSGVYSKYSSMPNYATTPGSALKFTLKLVQRLGSYYHEQATARVLLEVSKIVAQNSRTLTLEHLDAGGAPAPSQSLEAQVKLPKTTNARRTK
jgi:hypothetical protein